MRAASDDELFKALIDALPYLPRRPEVAAKLDEHKSAQLRAAIPGLKERAKTLVELLDGAGFLFATRPLKWMRRPRRFSPAPGASISRACCRA